MSEYDPEIVSWADQFAALLRDKVREMQTALFATGWDNLAHVIEDPAREENWKITYFDGSFWLTCLSGEDAGEMVALDLEALGVNRR